LPFAFPASPGRKSGPARRPVGPVPVNLTNDPCPASWGARQRAQQEHGLAAGGTLRQGLRRGDAEFAKHRPAGDVQAVLEEGAQGALGHLHGGGAKLADQAQLQVIGADLVLGERGRIALIMVAAAADVADVFFFGGPAKVFEVDKRGEFGDRWGVIHTAASVPVRAEARSPPI